MEVRFHYSRNVEKYYGRFRKHHGRIEYFFNLNIGEIMEITSHDKICILSLDKEFSARNCVAVRATLPLLADDDNVDGIILDFNNVRMLNSSTFGLILSHFQKFKNKGKQFILCQLSSNVQELFTRTNLDKLIKSYHTVPEALKEIMQK